MTQLNFQSDTSEHLLPSSTADQVLLDHLRMAINEGRLLPGDRIASIRELVVKYHLAFETVRAALGKLEEDGLLERRRGAGTFVAQTVSRKIKSRRTNAVANVVLLVDSKAHVYSHVTEELLQLLQNRGLFVTKLGWDESRGLEQLAPIIKNWRQNPPFACVVQLGYTGIEADLDKIFRSQTSIICLTRGVPTNTPCHSIQFNDLAAYKLAAQTLLDRGHTRLGLILHSRVYHPDQPLTRFKKNIGHTPLILAVAQEIRRRGIAHHGLTIHYNAAINNGDVNHPMAIEAAAQWLKRAKPTALLGSDFRVAAALRAAGTMNLHLNRDLDAVGIGGTPWAEAMGFSSVSYNEKGTADAIAELIFQGRESVDVCPRHILVTPRFIERGMASLAVCYVIVFA